jgi:hypothetical protein
MQTYRSANLQTDHIVSQSEAARMLNVKHVTRCCIPGHEHQEHVLAALARLAEPGEARESFEREAPVRAFQS